MNNHIKVITTIDLDETTCDCDAQDCQGCVPRYVVEDEVVYEQSYVRPGKTQREEVGRLSQTAALAKGQPEPANDHQGDSLGAAVGNEAVSSGAVWYPIETAPKDGTPLLLSNGKTREIGFWMTKEASFGTESTGGEALPPGWYTEEYHHPEYDVFWWQTKPTHWMPLPEGPESEEPKR